MSFDPGWDVFNAKNKGVKLKRKWKRLEIGEIFDQLTILTSGSGVERVYARCSCGNVDKYIASSVKTGKIFRCHGCTDSADRSLIWAHPKKWKNPKIDARNKSIRIRRNKIVSKSNAGSHARGRVTTLYLPGGLFEQVGYDSCLVNGYEHSLMEKHWSSSAWLDGRGPSPVDENQTVANHKIRDHGPKTGMIGKEWITLKKVWDNRCAYCGTRPSPIVFEHVIPISKGGRTEIGNIVPSCADCNMAKGSHCIGEIMASDVASAFNALRQEKIESAMAMLNAPKAAR